MTTPNANPSSEAPAPSLPLIPGSREQGLTSDEILKSLWSVEVDCIWATEQATEEERKRAIEEAMLATIKFVLELRSEVVPAPGLPREETGLALCPFCGCGVVAWSNVMYHPRKNCILNGKTYRFDDWNRRAPQTSSPSTTPTAPRSVEGEMRRALEKCVRDIEFWNEILDKEWRNFDGQLNDALNQARAALAASSPPLEAKTGSVEVEAEREALRAEAPNAVGGAMSGD